MRYAIYYTPPREHPLTQTAALWLGRDAYGSADSGVGHEYEAFIGSPRRYGFHGTLKAPFRLANSVSENELVEAFDAFLAKPRSVPVTKLGVGALGSFLALVPSKDAPDALRDLARQCVQSFEPFRAPLTEAEIQKRKPDALTETQLAYLRRYGYPYVLDEFRFHMTLTGSVADDAFRGELQENLSNRFNDILSEPIRMKTLAIFVEREPGADFEVFRAGDMVAIDEN